MIRVESEQKALGPPSDKRCQPQRKITEGIGRMFRIIAFRHLANERV